MMIRDLVGDVRHAGRLFRRNLLFSLAAIVSIGLAIGMNTAIFSLVDAVMLKRLPVHDPGRLVFLNTIGNDGRLHVAPPYPCLERFAGARALSGFAAFTFNISPVSINGRAEKVVLQMASASYFDVVGVRPVLGRGFVPDDERLSPAVAVIGHQYWQRRFGGAPDVVGRTIVYQDRPLTIVGVSAPGFGGLHPGLVVDVTVPIAVAGADALGATGRWWLDAVGRLADGASREQAHAQLDPIFQRFMTETGASGEMREAFARMAIVPAARGLRDLREQFGTPLTLLAGTAAIVLLIACANVATLLLARAAARRHELATRVAIGASRGRIVRQLLAESLLLGAAGTSLGLLFARWLVDALTGPLSGMPGPLALDLSFDSRIVIFSAGLCAATTAIFGLVPAVRASRAAASRDLERSIPGTFTNRLGLSPGALLVAVQITLSLTLLVVTSLLVSTLVNLRGVDAGFQPDAVTTFEIEFTTPEPAPGARAARWAAMLDRVVTLPGVESASLSWMAPLGRRDRGVGIRVIDAGLKIARPGGVALNHVSPGYFATLGIPILRGRALTPQDIGGSAPVAIIGEAAARYYFGDESPIGRRVEIAKAVREIVGVAADARHQSLRDEVPRFVYVPVLQPVDRMSSLVLAVRARGERSMLVDGVRRVTGGVESDVIVGRVATMRERIDQSLLRERLMATLSVSFGALGLVLAAVGLFGVMSSNVLARRRELAVRMALGASASQVRRRILGQSLIIAVVGVGAGIPLSLLGAQALETVLFGVRPTSVPALAGCAAMLIGVAALAAYLPARRASRLDPAVELRRE